MPLLGHVALLWATWPRRYGTPHPPEAVNLSTCFEDLIDLRMCRFAQRFHLYSPDDKIALETPPDSRYWNFLTAKEKSFKEPKKLHPPDELASFFDG
jgi:hypothetical protein